MNTDVRNIWENCLSFIKDNVTTDVYDVWFKPIEPVELTSDNTLVIMVPSMFFMEWIVLHLNIIDKLRAGSQFFGQGTPY